MKKINLKLLIMITTILLILLGVSIGFLMLYSMKGIYRDFALNVVSIVHNQLNQ